MPSFDQAKSAAATLAVRDFFGQNLRLKHGAIGIGSGTTIRFVVEEIKNLAKTKRPELLTYHYIPTSFQSRNLIVDAGLLLSDLDQSPILDVAFDGADEIDSRLNCIKGGGGAHLKEKVVASAAEHFIVVADFTKDSSQLGTSWIKGIPLEVLPMAHKNVCQALKSIGCKDPILRMGVNKAGPVITDSGNFIIDANFGPIDDAVILNLQLKNIPGILETGLFLGMATRAYLGQEDKTVSVRGRQPLSPEVYKQYVTTLESKGILNLFATVDTLTSFRVESHDLTFGY